MLSLNGIVSFRDWVSHNRRQVLETKMNLDFCSYPRIQVYWTGEFSNVISRNWCEPVHLNWVFGHWQCWEINSSLKSKVAIFLYVGADIVTQSMTYLGFPELFTVLITLTHLWDECLVFEWINLVFVLQVTTSEYLWNYIKINYEKFKKWVFE